MLAKANAPKSGDDQAGISAEDAVERVAARAVLSNVTLAELRNNPVVPYEEDEITRIVEDTLDEAAYQAVNAWWLAELSRLVYKQEDDETEDPAHTGRRKNALKTAHLQEAQFFNSDVGTQCAVVTPEPGSGLDDFAVLVFRGTHNLLDWLTNVKVLPRAWDGPGKVHAGFRDAFESVWQAVDAFLDTIAGPVFYTGHSLGGALATLAAARRAPQALYTFGAPRTGDAAFARALHTSGNIRVPTFRVVNNRDLVTRVPPVDLGFMHAGAVHYFTHDGRRLVNPSRDEMEVDRKQEDPFQDAAGWLERFGRPPESFADHSSCNYVTLLERELAGAQRG